MPYLFQSLFEEIMDDLKNFKTDVDKDRVIINNLIRMTNSLRGDVYNNIINMNFLNKVEIIKQYRQSVMYKDNVDFFIPVLEKFSKFKVLTMAVVYFYCTRIYVIIFIIHTCKRVLYLYMCLYLNSCDYTLNVKKVVPFN